ncbi:hypothetical protein A1F94_003234 [Pyrenophora tritici-repentis]|uniref:Uncharacterized protein n=1 Tax=Pyrenophora tritici-repentis TaxID=45151 RepID=A0A5M9LHL9_9PLEO|nr:hypothetical protein PtrV1_04448 [Pyrenophora tritici-repentis]KAF7574746.1 hypothetical protein PtrM4_063700 [Pyrenophora tritici-repentis]KAG9386484.1 hypothetical protein A1F94_003234 [Pyrenophora tritici-repentis]KAI0588088.1 hypothetical protein Alg130_03556 [Pyrenophora tritici-repentis]KAI0589739.1 hypothetical protein Alg215_00201 [Pyrenophora tritici-repentis]
MAAQYESSLARKDVVPSPNNKESAIGRIMNENNAYA